MAPNVAPPTAPMMLRAGTLSFLCLARRNFLVVVLGLCFVGVLVT